MPDAVSSFSSKDWKLRELQPMILKLNVRKLRLPIAKLNAKDKSSFSAKRKKSSGRWKLSVDNSKWNSRDSKR